MVHRRGVSMVTFIIGWVGEVLDNLLSSSSSKRQSLWIFLLDWCTHSWWFLQSLQCRVFLVGMLRFWYLGVLSAVMQTSRINPISPFIHLTGIPESKLSHFTSPECNYLLSVLERSVIVLHRPGEGYLDLNVLYFVLQPFFLLSVALEFWLSELFGACSFLFLNGLVLHTSDLLSLPAHGQSDFSTALG